MKRRLTGPYTFVLMVVLGLLIALQGKALQTGVKYVPLQQLNDFKVVLETEAAEVEQLKKLVGESKEKLSKLGANNGDDDEMIASLKSEIETMKIVSGMSDVEGAGVIVLITDGDRELLENEDPNNIIVHDVDIRTIVDDLWYAGAEAISINGQRILFNISEIYCNGPTIRVNNRRFSQPFIIRAIGDRKHLEAAINAPGMYGNTLRQWGIFVEVNTKIYMKIAGYEGEVRYQYLQDLDEGAVK